MDNLAANRTGSNPGAEQMSAAKRIQLSGHTDAFLILIHGREFGTIARVRRDSKWSICRGIGQAATTIGVEATKADAISRLEVAWEMDAGEDQPWKL